MVKANRLLYLINLIKSHHDLTAKELAEKCGVSERTIFRDANSLAAAGLPIYYDHGYRFLEGAFLPTLNLTDEELATLEFALDFSPLKAQSSLFNLAKGIQAKLRSNRGRPLPGKPTEHRCSATVAPPSPSAMSRFSTIFKLLKLAMDQKTVIRIEYESGRDGITERLIEPYALVQKNPKWLVLCYCQDCGTIASYEVNKIKNVASTAQPFKSKISLDKIFSVHQ
jgi:predicted DNA-binding transcriptional regulator YafY